jgi:hypothetical protein
MYRLSHMQYRLQKHLDRPPGAEYMWWNNVETKPGVGFPTQWEDQEKYHGGWELEDKPKNPELKLKLQNRLQTFANLFSNPAMPTMDDYYEPWTYNYGDLFNSPLGDDQPTARPISRIDGKPIDIESGPNWDDDLGGSNIYAVNDPLLADMSEEERQRLFSIEQLFYFYMPRICNHCLNAAVWRRVHRAQSTNAPKTAWCSSIRINAAAGACASQPARTRRPITTGQRANRKNVFCATRASKRDKPPPASIPVSDASVIWAFCCTTRIKFPKRSKCQMNNSSNASAR